MVIVVILIWLRSLYAEDIHLIQTIEFLSGAADIVDFKDYINSDEIRIYQL